ncbi:MAG TPA: ROK family protein [Actinocrinis sp.]|nr:ROK family protein [Actinocrinis sp.]
MVLHNNPADTPLLPGTPSLLRAINDRTALRLLAEHGPLSRTQIGGLAGLSKPTASQLMDRLLAVGLVEQVAAEPGVAADPSGPGRVARLYRLRAGAAYVAGLDVTPARIITRVCDLSGAILRESVLPTPGRTAVGAVDRVRQALDEATAGIGLELTSLHHVVIGLGGAVDPQTNRLNFARHLPGWHDSGLLERLRGGLVPASRLVGGARHPVVDLENDVNLAAVAEQTGGAASGCGNFVVLWISDGIGAAIVIDGKLHRGASGGAGEVGYMPVPGAPLVRTLNRGANGGFQSIAGAPAVLKLARAHGFTGADAPAAVARAVEAGPLGARLLSELADRLAVGLAPIVAVLDPELIVLTGAILRAGADPLREYVAEALHSMAIPRPRLVLSAVPDNPVLAGAIQAALTATRETVFSATFPSAA